MRQLTFTFFVLFFFITGCKTVEKTITDTKSIKSNEKEITCIASMETNINSEIRGIDSGKLLLKYDDLPKNFVDPIVIEIKKEYYYKNKVLLSKFELIYFGLTREIKKTDIKQNDVLGLSTGTKVSICVRSKELDPYLIACSDVMPIKSNDYWYYFPGMYVPTVMKWLSFKPADYKEFKAMHDHATSGEELLGVTMFNWWVVYQTSLPAYPEIKTVNSKNSIEQIIYFEDLPLRLYYQDGFLKYLQDEYKPGETIYLYLQISQINGFTKEFNCYVRDFSLVPPENIVDARLKHLGDMEQ